MLFKENAEIVAGNKLLGTPDRSLHYYDIVNMEQYQGFGYEQMADRVYTIAQNPKLRLNADILVDATGVGDAAVELIRKRGLYPIPIIFSGGGAPKEHYSNMGEIFSMSGSLAGAKILKDMTIPKKDLVAAGGVLMQQGRVRVAPGKWRDDFIKQLAKFKGKVNENTGNTKYGAENETDHDDLVVCYLMGSWWVLNRRDRSTIPERRIYENETTGWEPEDYM
jgi:hypothetical protein